MCKSPDIKPIYIGKTTNFVLRKSQHKQSSKTSQVRVYEFIRKTGGFQNWSIVEIEKCPCEDGREDLRRETELIHSLHAELNSYPIRHSSLFPPIKMNRVSSIPPMVEHWSPLDAPEPKQKRIPTEYEKWMKITAWIRTIDV